MQTPILSNRFNPWQLAAESGRFDGELDLAVLPRLAALLERTDGTVKIALAARIDERGLRLIEGTLQTDLELICQRCLGPLSLPLDVVVSLGLVHDEAESVRLPDTYDPLVVAGNDLSIADLVEDELLLALPSIPRHQEIRECEANGYVPSAESEPDGGRRGAFTTLASLLQDSKRSN